MCVHTFIYIYTSIREKGENHFVTFFYCCPATSLPPPPPHFGKKVFFADFSVLYLTMMAVQISVLIHIYTY